MIINVTSYAVLHHHYETFSLDESWINERMPQLESKIRNSSSVKLFTSFLILGAHWGLWFQGWLSTKQVGEGRYITRINMNKQRHSGFFQVAVRVSLALSLSCISLIPWLLTQKSDTILKKVIMNGILSRFMAGFFVFAFYRKIDEYLFPDEAQIKGLPDERSSEESIE